MASDPSLSGNQYSDDGENGCVDGYGYGVGRHMMHVYNEICAYASQNGPFGLKLKSLAWMPEWVAVQFHLG